MAVITEIDSRIYTVETPGGDYTGQTTTESGANGTRWASGTGTNQADTRFFDTRTLGAGLNEDLDLQTLTDVYGVALGTAEVRLVRIECPVANGDAIEVKPGAANGWIGMLKDPTDVLIVHQGGRITWECPVNGCNLVDATHKILNVTNTDGVSAITYTITILGCSA